MPSLSKAAEISIVNMRDASKTDVLSLRDMICRNEKLENLTLFTIVAIIALSAVEVAHILVLGTRNGKIFSALARLIDTITGIMMGRKT